MENNFETEIPFFYELLYERSGLRNSKKEIIDTINIIYPNINYIFNNNNLTITDKNNFKNNIIKKPNITVIEGLWNNSKIIKSISTDNLNKKINSKFDDDFFNFSDLEEEDYYYEEDNNKNTFSNILGDNNLFNCSNTTYYFKPQVATKELLSYYNCKLISPNDTIFFESNENMLLATIDTSFNYVEDYLLQEKYGGGIYLEYHNLPHFYFPNDELSEGYIIIGKKRSQNKYELSAFSIPYNYGIYIPPNVIHNDCYLTGEYNVCYGKSNNFSTAILKNNFELVSFHFL